MDSCDDQGGATGRLLAYSPATQKTTVLTKGLWFANGVALSADESFLAVVETPSVRVTRYWLKGPKVGNIPLPHLLLYLGRLGTCIKGNDAGL